MNTPKVVKAAKGQSYLELYKAAQKDSKTEQISFEFFAWEEEGKVLIGELIDFVKVPSKELGGSWDGNVNVYQFDTDDGKISCICGAMVDKLMDVTDYRGAVMAIEFKGKRTIKDNKECNIFEVTVISAPSMPNMK